MIAQKLLLACSIRQLERLPMECCEWCWWIKTTFVLSFHYSVWQHPLQFVSFDDDFTL